MTKRITLVALSTIATFGLSNMTACSRQDRQSHEVVWTVGSGPLPEILNSKQFATQEMTITSADETVIRSPQKWESAEIENAYSQQILNSKGELIYVKSHYYDEGFENYSDRIKKLDVNKYAFLEKMKSKDADLSYAKEIFAPKVLISVQNSVPELLYQIDFISKSGEGVYRIKVTPSMDVVSREMISSSFIDAMGRVFPVGPNFSDIADVVLKGMKGDGTLSKPSHFIANQEGETAVASNNIFNFDATDKKFDQVQAFYYVDRTIELFKQKLGVTLPFPLEVKTNIGVNAANYYHGTILLGPGDGAAYVNIMRDPTVVMHETGHAFVDAIARLPHQGEGGSLNEAFADFFTTSFLAHSKLGEASSPTGTPRRDLNNNQTLENRVGKVYPDSLIVSGTLWEIRNAIGEDASLKLAFKTLSRLGPSGNLNSFAQAVQYALNQGFKDEEKSQVMEILKKRKWVNN